jgi:hypothetical protein
MLIVPAPRAVGFAAVMVVGVKSPLLHPVNATLPAVPVGLEKLFPPMSVAPPASLTCRDVVSADPPQRDVGLDSRRGR